MGIGEFLDGLIIDQLYEAQNGIRSRIKRHEEQSRIPVWSVTVGGMGVADFRHYHNAAACLAKQMEKGSDKLAQFGDQSVPVDTLKALKASLDLYFYAESEARDACEDWDEESQ